MKDEKWRMQRKRRNKKSIKPNAHAKPNYNWYYGNRVWYCEGMTREQWEAAQ